jgi:AcrR family transcriptional regulator
MRQRIVAEASLRFRRDGVDATGVQTLMKALGLTHGAFYAHFASKDALVEEVLGAITENPEASVGATLAGENPIPGFVDGYLSRKHRDEPGTGCPLPTISAEIAQHGRASAQTDRLVIDRLDAFEHALSGADKNAASAGLLSTLVGALVLARSVSDPALSDRILDGARRWLATRVSS